MTIVKVCGIREVEHAVAAAAAGADLLGLIFYPPSHRYLTPEQARDLVQATRTVWSRSPQFVGVFVDEPIDFVNEVVGYCGLDFAQLSGHEDWASCQAVEAPVIKSLRIEPDATIEEVRAQLTAGEDLIASGQVRPLLDTQHPGYYGGTGRRFNWELAGELAREFPFLLAGGLTPDNVAQALRVAHPWGLDVSSGVETDQRKDTTKIQRFLAAVRSTEYSALREET